MNSEHCNLQKCKVAACLVSGTKNLKFHANNLKGGVKKFILSDTPSFSFPSFHATRKVWKGKRIL